MQSEPRSTLSRLLRACLGESRGDGICGAVRIDPSLLGDDSEDVSRATFAMALNLVLFDDLLQRVPSGAAYVAERIAAGEQVRFDHGAIRTIRFPGRPTGALPAGELAFRRILQPLGYRVSGHYPLPALRMTGRSYAHADHPHSLPQFFVSELHVERFDPAFGEAASRVFESSRDPLGPPALALLARFEAAGAAPFAQAAAGLPAVAASFGRHHGEVRLSDYLALRAASAEAAWIATEGNAFNHATDRVGDVDALAAQLRAAGRPIKDKVEHSASGRVRQTAFRADPVDRIFLADDGTKVSRPVPGSFYEFISRDIDPGTGLPDLGFDSANATGIFAMTRAA